eukprot:COSAG02_NODE_664_length_18739_cov_11.071567_12_plen_93_part_00
MPQGPALNQFTIGNALYVVGRAFNFAGGEDIPLVLGVLAEIFGSAATADFFFPNDQKSMIDVLIRNLEDAPGYPPSVRQTVTPTRCRIFGIC